MFVLKNNLIIILLFSGCGDTHPSKIESKRVENVSVQTEEDDLLHQLGFDIQNEKITIDINQTNNFFQEFEARIQKKSNEIEKKIQASDLNFSKDIGIEVKGTHIGIDLNKTRSMFEKINILMKEILLDTNNSK